MTRNYLLRLQLGLLLLIGFIASAQTTPQQQQAAERAEKILHQMTLEEKIAYIGGYNDFYIRAIPRLGVPELKMSDGPIGLRNDGDSTAYPAGIALAASWDTELAKRMGAAMGSDARARGVHFLLGPGVNIYRAPMGGRNFEYFGEDPYLASRMAVADIEGIQSQGVIATVKHYAGNNQEWDRHNVSSDIDERTLREIYLPAFEYAVKEAHVGAIMDSYNLLNGVHLTQNGRMNTEISRQDWGFTGIVMSDWDATYDGVAAANGGLDIEMPNGKFMSPETILAAVKSGAVKEATIDDKVRHILETAIEFGFFDRPQKIVSIPLNDPESRAVALKAAQEGAVLLKNSGILPLDRAKIKTIAVIGPNAGVAVTGGGGSSLVHPFAAATPVQAIRELVGSSVNVSYQAGVLLTADLFKNTPFTTTPDGNMPGMVAEFFNNRDLAGPPALKRTDAHIAFNWGEGSYTDGGPTDNFSARWSGYFTPAESGTYGFSISGDDGFRLFVDDKPVIEQWQYQGETLVTKKLPLTAGHHYKLKLEYFEGTGQASIGFGISNGVTNAMGQGTEAARHADAVILCVGFDDKTEGEGADRSFDLPEDQLALIHSVEAANKNTIIVLNAGGNVDMTPFLDATPALLHVWYSGQEGAKAMAQIVFGDVNPSGKLPVSFERRWEDNATYNSYYDKTGSKHVKYTEGVFLGYRHFDKTGIKPMFPFGFGLSYTTFQYGGLQIVPAQGDSHGTVAVTFQITNTGAREGAETAEVFVADKHAKIERPVKELKGFAKVNLKPGETRPVTIQLDRRAFAYYDVVRHQWTVVPGTFDILVGGSAEKIFLQGKVNLSQ
jgi:beta-glucosidase